MCQGSETTQLSCPHFVLPETALCKGGRSLDLESQAPRICSRATCFALSPDLGGCFSSALTLMAASIGQAVFFYFLSRQQVIMASRSSPHALNFISASNTTLLCSTRVSDSHLSPIQSALTQVGVIKPGCSTWTNQNNNNVHISQISYLQIMFAHVGDCLMETGSDSVRIPLR